MKADAHTLFVTGSLSSSEQEGMLLLGAMPGVPDGTMVEGTSNGYPIRGKVTGESIEISRAAIEAAQLKPGCAVTVEITRMGEEPEPRPPADLCEALASRPAAYETWTQTTANARRDWILFITTAKQPETRKRRIDRAVDQLGRGQRRVCCFGGLNWLTKAHPNAETWLPLP